ncbi:MAG: DUF1566 domain-containing protein [bacterium]
MSIKSLVSFALTCAAAAALVAGTALAADPAVKCESGKLKEASKYSSCRLKADSKAVKKGEAADYAKCETKFADKWAKAENKAGAGNCPSEGDQSSMDSRITLDTAEIATLLAGGNAPTCSVDCGNGIVDAGEDCDFGDLNGDTCAGQGQFGSGLACGSGCVFDTGGCSATRYEDTGLGTVIDHQAGLEWQKTDDAGGLTDKDNSYSWSDAGGVPGGPHGTAFFVFLSGLNAPDGPGANPPQDWTTDTGCYAGRCDWRVPVLEELVTIIDCSFGDPCVDQSVFGPTNPSSKYWSSTTDSVGLQFPNHAWLQPMESWGAHTSPKTYEYPVRAVRGGP